MERHKLLGDHMDHFLVQHPSGEIFTISKKGMHPAEMRAVVQHFADGGAVTNDYMDVKHPDGSVYSIHKSLLPKFDDGGAVTSAPATKDDFIKYIDSKDGTSGVPAPLVKAVVEQESLIGILKLKEHQILRPDIRLRGWGSFMPGTATGLGMTVNDKV